MAKRSFFEVVGDRKLPDQKDKLPADQLEALMAPLRARAEYLADNFFDVFAPGGEPEQRNHMKPVPRPTPFDN